MFFFFILHTTLKNAKVNQKSMAFKMIVVNFSQLVVIKILQIYGSIIMPLKIFIYLVRMAEIMNSTGNNGVMSILLSCWITADWLLSLLVVLITHTFLRSLGGYLGPSGIGNSQGSSDIFAKMDGYAEQLVEFGFQIFCILTSVSARIRGKLNGLLPDTLDNQTIYWVFYLIRVGILLSMIVIYFVEMPYFNKFTEKLTGYLLFMFTLFFIIFGATQEDLPLTLKIWCVILPFQAISTEYLLKSSYRSDYLDRSKKKSFKVIKKLLVDGHGNGSVEEKLFDGGILKNYLVSGKNINKQYL